MNLNLLSYDQQKLNICSIAFLIKITVICHINYLWYERNIIVFSVQCTFTLGVQKSHCKKLKIFNFIKILYFFSKTFSSKKLIF